MAAGSARGFRTTSAAFGKPISIEMAKTLPRDYNEMSNDIIQVMAIDGDSDAKEERLIRNIMAVDDVEWVEAKKTFDKIRADNRAGSGMYKLPYYVGITTAVTGALASIPLCFDLNTVLYFNEHFVTTEVPGDEDLETFLEVGSWAWNWMEPPLGQASFFLLCMQFARNQLINIHAKPYTEFVKNSRANKLCYAYPQYSRPIMYDFATDDILRD